MNAENQIKAIAIISIVYGGIVLLFLSILAPFVIGMEGWGPNPALLILFGLIGFLYISLFIIGGIGLLKHKNWARILLIVLAIINIPGFPIGTAFGVWFLIILFNDEVKALMN